MNCRYCKNEIVGKPLKIGPAKLGLNYCNKKCSVLDSLRDYPGTSLAGMLKKAYPEYML